MTVRDAPALIRPHEVDAHALATEDEVCASRSLRSGTREDHLATERQLDLGGLRSPEELAGVLRGWACVWQEIDRAAGAPGCCRTAYDELRLPAAQALRWLGRDLAELGGGAPDLGSSASGAGHELDELLARPAGGWGVAYVLLGSRLGGAMLAPQVRMALDLPAGTATSFFASDGTRPGRDWVAFKRRLDAADWSLPVLATAVEAARWTFRRVGDAVLAGRDAGLGAPA